ncbi:MAG TPA: tol-pal system-associated acyl-CoA thioesterase [Steroidobacteraceae bacterium]|jgi:acyl-CoA thioester hydrolase|nr:tol-pal system-associated acyl-CoA thioesterase [Steroidobacteraceae bacterium]
MSVFAWQARVYWEDTDAGGIVYYANYLRFMERARTEWLRARGIWQAALEREAGAIFTVVDLQVRYRLPARLDDLLWISCEAARDGGASIAFGQRIWRDRVEGELLLSGSARVACLDAKTFRPRRLPPVVVEALMSDN